MQLRPATKNPYVPSTGYFKQPLLAIEGYKSQSETPVIYDPYFFLSASISDLSEGRDLAETSITLQTQKSINKLEKIYIFENPEEIKNFLLINDYLIDILVDAPSHIHRIFGYVPIYLQLHHDHEEGWDELFVIIKSPYSPEEAISRENRLAEEWFLDKMEATQGKLNIIEEPL